MDKMNVIGYIMLCFLFFYGMRVKKETGCVLYKRNYIPFDQEWMISCKPTCYNTVLKYDKFKMKN
jgi:hypothetical protein